MRFFALLLPLASSLNVLLLASFFAGDGERMFSIVAREVERLDGEKVFFVKGLEGAGPLEPVTTAAGWDAEEVSGEVFSRFSTVLLREGAGAGAEYSSCDGDRSDELVETTHLLGSFFANR